MFNGGTSSWFVSLRFTSNSHKVLKTLRVQEVIEILEAAGKLDAVMFTANGPAGIFAIYATPGVSLGRIFLNEFVCVCPFFSRNFPSARLTRCFATGLPHRTRHLGVPRPHQLLCPARCGPLDHLLRIVSVPMLALSKSSIC